MKKILQFLFEHKTLSTEQAKDVLLKIGSNEYNEHEVAAFITVYLMRNITIHELLGFREALLELCIPIRFDAGNTIDIVGTGGDGKDTFNISTLSCFIVAGAGQKVTKHGNYGASSVSGSSNVMEQLGYKLKNNPDALARELDEANICFLHAPLFHPALKIVAPVRKNLGIRTFFNLLGPLVNPCNPAYHCIGVYNLEIARMYHYLLQQLNVNYTIIHSLEGYDEISLTGDTKVLNQTGERVYSAEQLGKRIVAPQDIYGGKTVGEAAKIFKDILSGEGSFAQNAVVLANAAMALFCTGAFTHYDAAYQAAVASLESGKALGCFQKLISLQ